MATRVVSEVQKINSAIADVYAFLSDFSKIGKLIETARQMGAGNQMPELADKIEDVRTTVDACTFMVKGVGEMGMKIVEREEPKLIKLEGDGRLPFEFQVWIQLLDNGPYDTRLRITAEAELNMMMKMLLKGKLEKGINQLAEGLGKVFEGKTVGKFNLNDLIATILCPVMNTAFFLGFMAILFGSIEVMGFK